MIDTDSTVCLTLAGAMTPIGIGRTISAMIDAGFIDWIVSTGANVYHDLHFAYDLPVRQGHFDVDDDILYSKQIVRIYDVYIKEMGTLQAQDIVVQREIKRAKNIIPQNASTADIAYALGKAAKENGRYPEKSFLVKAYEHKVPVYMPAIGDSSIGLNMLPLLFEDKGILPNVILDVAESANTVEEQALWRFGAWWRSPKELFPTNWPSTSSNIEDKGRWPGLSHPVDRCTTRHRWPLRCHITGGQKLGQDQDISQRQHHSVRRFIGVLPVALLIRYVCVQAKESEADIR